METKRYPAVNEKIRVRRQELRLKDTDIARLSGMTVQSYGDIEAYIDEIYAVPSLAEVRGLCDVLRVNCLDLFELPCVYCEGRQISADDRLPRHELIHKRREALHLTVEELADKIGYYGKSIEVIESGNLAHLDSWVINEVLNLATVLNVPPQLLLDFKCHKCGH